MKKIFIVMLILSSALSAASCKHYKNEAQRHIDRAILHSDNKSVSLSQTELKIAQAYLVNAIVECKDYEKDHLKDVLKKVNALIQ